MEPNNILKKELKSYVTKNKISAEEVTYLVYNDYNNFQAVF